MSLSKHSDQLARKPINDAKLSNKSLNGNSLYISLCGIKIKVKGDNKHGNNLKVEQTSHSTYVQATAELDDTPEPRPIRSKSLLKKTSARQVHPLESSRSLYSINLPSLFVGLDTPCPTLKGPPRPYVYLDNGASTPSLTCVQELLNAYLPYYSSAHRGTGFKSLLTTHLFEQTRSAVLNFVNANSKDHVCIFTRNTTESINKLARRFP